MSDKVTRILAAVFVTCTVGVWVYLVYLGFKVVGLV